MSGPVYALCDERCESIYNIVGAIPRLTGRNTARMNCPYTDITFAMVRNTVTIFDSPPPVRGQTSGEGNNDIHQP